MRIAKRSPTGTSQGALIPSSALVDFPMGPMHDTAMDAAQRRAKAEAALHVISKAEEHRKDKTLMRDVKKLAKEKMTHYSKLCE